MQLKTFLLFISVFSGLFTATISHADISALVFDNHGPADKIIYTGHSAVVLWDICADSPIKIRPCTGDDKEWGVVLNKLPKMSAEKYNWMATPVTEFFYGASTPNAAPIIANEAISAAEDDKRYDAYYGQSIADRNDKGRWRDSIGVMYVRTVYEYKLSGFYDDEIQIMNILNSTPNVSNYDIFFHNCADFTAVLFKLVFQENITHSINGGGLHAPKALAMNLTKLALKHPEIEMHVIKHPQIPGDYKRSNSVMAPSENLYKNPLFAVPLALLIPEIPIAAVVLNEVIKPFRQESAYRKNLTPEEKESILGTKDEWKSYRAKFSELVKNAKNDSSLPAELHAVIVNSKSDKDFAKKLVEYFAHHGTYETTDDDIVLKLPLQGEATPRTVGMTRDTVETGDKQIGYLVMLADLGAVLYESARTRSSMEVFKDDWSRMLRLNNDGSRDPASLEVTDDVYDQLFPYSTTQCAVSQMIKKAPHAEVGGAYGHSLLYIRGACRDTSPDVSFPKLKMCTGEKGDPTGAIVSLDSIYSNTSFIAMDGKEWLFNAGLAEDQPLTQEYFDQVVERALKTGAAKGMKLDDGSSDEEEISRRSTQTDWAVSFARDAACVRIPMNKKQVQAMVDALNHKNEVYVTGKKRFEWNEISNNCVTLIRGILAKIGFRENVCTPHGVFKPLEELNEAKNSTLPIPAMDLVQTIDYVNKVSQIDTAENVYANTSLRNYFNHFYTLPAASGGSVEFVPMHETDNELYAHGKMIFDKLTGHTNESKWKNYLEDPNFSTVAGNLKRILNQLKSIQSGEKTYAANDGSEVAKFAVRYNAWITATIQEKTQILEQLNSSQSE